MYKIIILSLAAPWVFKSIDAKLYLKAISVFDDHFIANDEPQVQHGKRTEERINLSFPGTRWCGPGNTASAYDQLGYYNDTDMCCRDHDHCDALAAGETKYGLTNDDIFTRLHCQCDRKFKDCLKHTNNKVSMQIGYMYFSVRDRCYMNEHPILECQRYESRFFLRRCIEYILDTSKPKLYQWFDLPFFGSQDDSHVKC